MKQQDAKYLAYGAGILAGYFLVVKPLLVKLGLQKDPETQKVDDRKTQQLADVIKQQQAGGQKLTKTVAEWQSIADAIYNDLRYSAIDDDKDDATYQAARVQNDLDFWYLYKLFGKRREYLFGIPSGGLKDLPTFLRSNLSKEQLAKLNWNYKNKGIKFQY